MSNGRTLPVISVLLGVFVSAPIAAQAPLYDLILRNARIVDGSGSPAYRGDIAVRGDNIVAIGNSLSGPAIRVIDVEGQVVAPGFIDVHNHGRGAIFRVPTADNLIRQGVTTLIEGPDGNSPVPLAPFFKRLETLRKSINIGSFIGQGSVREAIMGRINRPPSSEQLNEMRELVAQGMKDGAFGLSTGLVYVPGTFTSTEEIIELAKVAGRLGGHYQSHIRSGGNNITTAVAEAIKIGEQGKLPAQVTHHKAVGQPNWKKSLQTLRLVDSARAKGLDVTIDQYPYTSVGGNIESSLFRPWVLEGSHDDIVARLNDPKLRAQIKQETANIIRNGNLRGNLSTIVISRCSWDESLAGKTLADLARLRTKSATPESGADVAMWILEQGGCGRVSRDSLAEDDVERILRHPATMVASDGNIPLAAGAVPVGAPHPRSYGTFPRVLAVYVRERKVLRLEEAIRKMSALPAKRLALTARGMIQKDMKADLVVFDPARVRDTATLDQPHQYPEGIPLVIVNGQIAFENGAMTQARPGRVLYGPARANP